LSPMLIPGGATIVDQRNFDADIWGFRLGPYAEYPLGRNVDLWFSGGLAVGLLDGSAAWKETASLAGGGTMVGSGGGSDLGLLWGGYLSAKVSWQLSERWSAEGGVQYQYLGTYEHNFGGQVMQLDLSKSMFYNHRIGLSFLRNHSTDSLFKDSQTACRHREGGLVKMERGYPNRPECSFNQRSAIRNRDKRMPLSARTRASDSFAQMHQFMQADEAGSRGRSSTTP